MIDFRSDTVTQPTDAMREAMAQAKVGDDVYGDDPTIKALETYSAKLLNKEKALFFPSGTMANQVAIMSHTQPSDEIILGKHSHIKNYEVGAASALSGVGYSLVDDAAGHLNIGALKAAIRGEDIHFPKTTLICSEMAHSLGKVAPLDTLKETYHVAKNHHIAHHLDGARLFNAAIALGVEAKEIARYTDSLMFCLSKGLSAPIGSMLLGTEAFIKRALKYRKMLGGGMRQVGVLGAPGLVALQEMTNRLSDDHKHARYLAEGLASLGVFEVNHKQSDINMVFVKATIDMEAFKTYMQQKGILLGGYKGEYMRLMTHREISKKSIDVFLDYTKQYLDKLTENQT